MIRLTEKDKEAIRLVHVCGKVSKAAIGRYVWESEGGYFRKRLKMLARSGYMREGMTEGGISYVARSAIRNPNFTDDSIKVGDMVFDIVRRLHEEYGIPLEQFVDREALMQDWEMSVQAKYLTTPTQFGVNAARSSHAIFIPKPKSKVQKTVAIITKAVEEYAGKTPLHFWMGISNQSNRMSTERAILHAGGRWPIHCVPVEQVADSIHSVIEGTAINGLKDALFTANGPYTGWYVRQRFNSEDPPYKVYGIAAQARSRDSGERLYLADGSTGNLIVWHTLADYSPFLYSEIEQLPLVIAMRDRYQLAEALHVTGITADKVLPGMSRQVQFCLLDTHQLLTMNQAMVETAGLLEQQQQQSSNQKGQLRKRRKRSGWSYTPGKPRAHGGYSYRTS